MMPDVPGALHEAIYQDCGAQLNNSRMRLPQAATLADRSACQAPGRRHVSLQCPGLQPIPFKSLLLSM